MPASTKSFHFPDINVWIALTWDGHVHHRRAADWFGELDDDSRLFFCRFTQLGMLRLLTSEAVMGPDVMTQRSAWQAYDHWQGDDRVGFLDEPVDLEARFRSMTRLKHPAPKDWADSYLAAFAETSDLTLVTFDTALKARTARTVLLTPAK
jgi:toxin-antitoxin system PIN domain toxin